MSINATAFFRVSLQDSEVFFSAKLSDHLGGWTEIKDKVIGKTVTVDSTTNPTDVDYFLLLENGDYLLLEDGDKLQLETTVFVERFGIMQAKVVIQGDVLRRTSFQDEIAGHTAIKDKIVSRVRIPAT